MCKKLSAIVSVCLLVLFLAACGGAASSPAPAASPAPAVSSVAASNSAAPATSSESAAPIALDGIATTLAQAAGLGVSVPMAELDLIAANISTENIAQFVGLQSQLVVENGAAVIIIEATGGKAAELATAMESYRDFAVGNEDYAQFATARENIAKAIIKTQGSFVIYAVSATDSWDALDAAVVQTLADLNA